MAAQSTASRLQTALHAIAPEGVAVAVAEVGPAQLNQLADEEAAWCAEWGVHRRAEFASGRRCARRALRCFGIEGGALLPDEDGLPRWPEGCLGSISHSRGLAAAVAASIKRYSLLGLDLEKTNRLSAGAMRRVLHPLEVEFAQNNQERVSILFSLKEAFYKAQYARWRCQANFRNLALAINLKAGTAEVAGIDPRFVPKLKAMRFRFCRVDDYVASLAWLEQMG